MKRKIVNGFLLMALLVSSMGTFVSCKDYDEDIYVDLRGRVTDLASQLEALQRWQETLKTCSCDLENRANISSAEWAQSQTAIDRLTDAITALTGVGYDPNSGFLGTINNINQAITDAKTDIQSVLTLLGSLTYTDADGNVVNNLNEIITEMNNAILLWNEKLKEVKDSTSYALTLAKTDSALIVNLQKQIDELKKDGKYHVWTIGADGYWYDNGTKTDQKAIGTNGTDGDQWTIGDDGYWYQNGKKTDYVAIGQNGTAGDQWYINDEGYWVHNGEVTDKKAIGTDGDQWTIGSDGYWYKNGEKTGTKATGGNGTSDVWTIGPDGYWYQNGVKTDNKAIGENGTNGTNGTNGKDGDQWYINDEGYWVHNGEVTNYKALGENGTNGTNGLNGTNGDSWSIGADSLWYKNGELYKDPETGEPLRAIGRDGNDGKIELDDENLTLITTTILNSFNITNFETIHAIDSILYVTYNLANHTDTVINELMQNIETNYYNQTQINDTITYLTNLINSVYNTGEFSSKVEEILNKYTYTKGYIDTLSNNINVSLNNIRTDISNIKSDLNNLVTGIVVQATQNPVFGNLNLPLDARSTMLFAYFGKAEGYGFYFPTTIDGNYVDKEEAFTEEEVELLGISEFDDVEGYVDQDGGIYINETDGNVGKVYFTVNPNDVSLDGKTFSLVNSLGQESPVALSTPKKSDKLLTFGWDNTRGSQTTMYEADATLSKDDVLKVYMPVDEQNLISKAKDVLSSVKSRSVKSIAEAGALFAYSLASTVNNTIPAYGLQAAWSDTDGNSHSATSQMNMAVSAIKPLSFATLQPLQGKKFPGMSRLQDFTSRALDKIFDTVNEAIEKIGLPTINVDNIHFDRVSIDPMEDGRLSIKVEVVLPEITVSGTITKDITVPVHITDQIYIAGGNVYDNDGRIIGSYDPISYNFDVEDEVTTSIQITLSDYIQPIDIQPQFYVNGEGGGNTFYIDYTDDINEVIANIESMFNDEMGSIEEQLADLLESVRELNQLGENIEGAVSGMEDQVSGLVNSFITSVYNKLNSVIASRAYRLFDVCLVGHQTGTGISLISQSKRVPTKVTGSITLVPTSYTLELFAPAYKKFVAVTHVYNADGTDAPGMQSLIKAANKGRNMMKVIYGEKTLKLSGQAGYTYEVSYAAVDYKGQMTRKKFYVQFK